MAFDWGTDVSQGVEDAINRLDDYNSAPFNASTNPGGLAGGGHITNFPAALTDSATVANGFTTFANLMAAYANAASASAASAAESASNISGSSGSSVTLSTGNKSFTTQADKAWPAGTYLFISSDANPTTHWIVLLVTAYAGTSLSGTSVLYSGSGSRTDWTIRATGVPTMRPMPTYLWSTGTTATDPTSGRMKFNATPGSATAMYISETDFDGNALSAYLATWDDSPSAIKGRLFVRAITQPSNFAIVDITSTVTDNGAWDAFSVAAVAAGGTLTDGMQVSLAYIPTGAAGDAGPAGASYSATSTTSLPISTGTKAFTTQAGLAYNASSRARAADASNPSVNYMEGFVTGYTGTSLTILVDNTSGSGTFNNWIISLTGDRGPIGATGLQGATGTAGTTGATGPAGPTTAPTWNFDSGQVTAGDPGTNEFGLNSTTMSSVSSLFINETGPAATSLASLIQSWDDSTNVTYLGTLFIVQTTDSSKYGIFQVGSVTDNGTYNTVTLSNGLGPGGFTNGAVCAFSFTRAGNAGAGSGDVVGPAIATNNAIVLYNTGTGKSIKDSLVDQTTAPNALSPITNDNVQLGTTTRSWSDIFLATGGVLNWANGNVTVTHSTGVIQVTAGDLRMTTAGTNAASVVTVGGTQTLTGKTLTSPVITTPTGLVSTDVGLGNVNNTSDANKPVSSAEAAINAIKRVVACRAATTAPITISTALNNADVLDGVTLATGDLVLVKDQSPGGTNGIYVVGVTPSRHTEYDAFNDYPGTLVTVSEGTAGNDTVWLCSSNAGGTIDSTALAFTRFAGQFPASTTDNTIARYDGVAGNLQASGVVIDDSNNLSGIGTLSTAGLVSTPASATGSAGLRVAHGVAPSSPVNGDIWTTTTSFNVRLNAATFNVALLEAAQTVTGNRTFSGTVALPATVTYTSQGSIVKSGNHALTLTTTGTTNVTFPAGTVTLASSDAATLTSGTLPDARLSSTAVPYGKQAIGIPATAMVPAITNGPATGNIALTNQVFNTKDFDASTQETCFFPMRMPESWNESTVSYRVTWSHAATSTVFGVVFDLACVGCGDNEAGDPTYGTPQTVTDVGGTTNNIYISPESVAITPGGTIAPGDFVWFRLRRVPADGGDSMTIDARVHEVTIYITTTTGVDT